MGNCAHENVEPVNLIVTGEHVADICADCLSEVRISTSGVPIALCDEHDMVWFEEFGGKVQWQGCRRCGHQTPRRVR